MKRNIKMEIWWMELKRGEYEGMIYGNTNTKKTVRIFTNLEHFFISICRKLIVLKYNFNQNSFINGLLSTHNFLNSLFLPIKLSDLIWRVRSIMLFPVRNLMNWATLAASSQPSGLLSKWFHDFSKLAAR